MKSTAIVLDNVSKAFRLYHERPTTLKERVVQFKRRRYDLYDALKDVTLEIDHGDTFGLIGANGSGKSTLLKVIAGIMPPDHGSVETDGRIASLLELGAGFHPDLTGRENVFLNASILGLSKRETQQNFDQIVSFAELEEFIDLPVRHFSSGMYVRLGFAVAVHVHPRIMLVDEVLSVGDEAFQRKCIDKMRSLQREGRTIVLVTHSVDVVRDFCRRAAFLHHGKLVSVGKPQDVIRVFRETLHGEAHLETESGAERGTMEATILSVSIQDGDGNAKQVFKVGDELNLVLDVEATRPIDDPIIGISFYDDLDRIVFGTNTALQDMRLGTLSGKARVKFSVDRLPFQDGKYQITAAIHSRDNRTAYHWKERFYSFRCVNTGRDVGPIHVPCKVTVTDISKERNC